MPDIMKIEYNTRVLNEAISLQKKKNDVYVVGFSNNKKMRHFFYNGVKCFVFYLNDHRNGIKYIYRIITAVQMFTKIYLFIIKNRFDIYHAHNFHVLPACVLAAKIRRKKVIYDTHETWTIHRGSKNHPEHIFAFIIEKIFLKFVDGFITVNEMIVDYYKKLYNVTKDYIVLYNTRSILPVRRNKFIHDELKIERNKVIVLFQGGFWGKSRGIFELIEAARYIKNNAVIVLLGYGTKEIMREINKKIEKARLQTRVRFMSSKHPDELLKYTMSADIGMNLINRVGKAQDFQSPWKLFEYCMAGLAVVSTDLPFHRRVHEKYEIGPLVNFKNNPKEIADAVNILIDQPHLLHQYQRNARRAAEEEFNWEIQEQKLLALYKRIMNEEN